VGKTTAARILREYLGRRGYQVHATTEPSLSALGETARRNTETYRGYTLACLVAADRYHRLETEVRPHLDADFIVVCDRYVASSFVLQRMDCVRLPFVEAINSAAERPDLAVILQAPPNVTAARVTARGAHDRFHIGECSSEQESDLYEEAAKRLAARGFPILAVETGEASRPTSPSTSPNEIAEIVECPESEAATA
jgi:dTMP kinase